MLVGRWVVAVGDLERTFSGDNCWVDDVVEEELTPARKLLARVGCAPGLPQVEVDVLLAPLQATKEYGVGISGADAGGLALSDVLEPNRCPRTDGLLDDGKDGHMPSKNDE